MKPSIGDQLARIGSLASKTIADPLVLPELLVQTERYMRSSMVTLEFYTGDHNQLKSIMSSRPDILSETREPFEQHYVHINPRLDVTFGKPVGQAVSDDLLGDDNQLMRYEFYSDFLAPSDLRYFLGTHLQADENQRVIFCFQRSANCGRYDDGDRQRMAHILPVMSNAAVAAFGLSPAGIGAVSQDEVFEKVATPLFICDASGGVLQANRAARALRANNWLHCNGDGILRSQYRALEQAIARAIRDVLNGASTALQTGSVVGRTFAVRTFVLANPAAVLNTATGSGICLMVEGLHQTEISPDTREHLGLTNRETQVGCLLSMGMSIDNIAKHLRISRHTVRTHCAMLRGKLHMSDSLGVAAAIRNISRVEVSTTE